jgi:membrane dipeptidase
MINYGSSFLTEEANQRRGQAERDFEAYLEGSGLTAEEADYEAFEKQWEKDNPYPYADLSDVLDHIDRAVELAGIDHVGLGSDYDGVGDSLPTGLKDASTMPNLVQGLMDRGYSEEDIVKILSGNALRVWEEVERTARRLR